MKKGIRKAFRHFAALFVILTMLAALSVNVAAAEVPEDAWYAKVAFVNATYELPVDSTGKVQIEYDAVPFYAGTNVCVGLVEKNNEALEYNNLNLIVRFAPDGFIDAYNGGYQKVNELVYEANKLYHIIIQTDIEAQVFSAWVRLEDGTVVQIADNYAYRSSAPVAASLGKMVVRALDYDDDVAVFNYTSKDTLDEMGGTAAETETAAEETPEATAEPTPEVTPAATAEPTPEATPDQTVQETSSDEVAAEDTEPGNTALYVIIAIAVVALAAIIILLRKKK